MIHYQIQGRYRGGHGSESGPGSEYEEMSWDPCSESQTGQEIEDEGLTSYQRARGAFTANASFGTMTHVVDHLDGRLDEDESELGSRFDNVPDHVDLTAVYVSLAPMSRAHPHEDSLNEITSPRQHARLQDDWAHSASNSTRVPFNTPVLPKRHSQVAAGLSVPMTSGASILQEESDGSEGYEVEAMDFETSERDTGLHHNIHEIGGSVYSPAPRNSTEVSNDSKHIEDGNATLLLQTRLNAVNEVMSLQILFQIS